MSDQCVAQKFPSKLYRKRITNGAQCAHNTEFKRLKLQSKPFGFSLINMCQSSAEALRFGTCEIFVYENFRFHTKLLVSMRKQLVTYLFLLIVVFFYVQILFT